MQQLSGKITSLPTAQTAKIEVVRRWTHPKYHKIISRRKSFLVQCEIKAAVGDRVALIPTPPTSKRKRWRVAKII